MSQSPVEQSLARPAINQLDVLYYEAAARPWVGWISWPPLQALVGKYLAWVVNRKYKAYIDSRRVAHAMRAAGYKSPAR